MTQLFEEYAVEEAQAEDKDQLLILIREGFVLDEPLNKSVNLQWNECDKYFDRQVSDLLVKKSSIVAREKTTGRIVGCALNNICIAHSDYAPENVDNENEKLVKMNALIDLLRSSVISTMMTGIRYMEIITLSVHPTAYRKGLAKRMVNATIKKAIEKRCTRIISIVTNYKSQALLAKFNFTDFKVVQLDKYCNDNGIPIFQCNDGTKMVKLVCLSLN